MHKKKIQISSNKGNEIETLSKKIEVEGKKDKKEDKLRLIDKIKNKVISTISKKKKSRKKIIFSMSSSSHLDKIKKLRELTGVGYGDCNIAINECGGDIEKSIKYLRIKGISKAI